MKFQKAWENVVKSNLHLKICLSFMTIGFITLTMSTAVLALKKPIVIERGCFSRSSLMADEKQTPLEYEEFLKQSLSMRFNSDSDITEGYLSVSEKRSKETELKNLAKNNLNQTVIVRGFEFKKDFILVEMDRVFAVKSIRSTLPLKVKVKIESKKRTLTNPYGLILVKTTELKKGKKK